MSDQDSIRLDAEVEAFRTAAAPYVRPPGMAQARATVARRRTVKVRAVAFCVVAALTVAIPVSLYAVAGRGRDLPIAPGSGTPTGSPATGSPTAAPSASPSHEPSQPDGRITLDQLKAGPIQVPPWGWAGNNCPSGRVRLGSARNPGEAGVFKVVYANLDGDPALETAALLACRLGEAYTGQVVALDRDATGAIVALGQVVRATDQTQLIFDLTPGPDGQGVVVDVANEQACCGTPVSREHHRYVGYAWNGSGYAETGTVTTPGPGNHVTDLTITAGKVALGPVTAGRRRGSLTVTVHNAGPLTSARYGVVVNVGCDPYAYVVQAGWIGPHQADVGPTKGPFLISSLRTFADPLPAGGTVTKTVTLSVDAAGVRPGCDYGGVQLAMLPYSDPGIIRELNPDNNSVGFQFTGLG
jgi:hypothetical protein